MRWGAAVAVLALVAGACAGGGTAPASDTTSSTGPTTPAESAGAAPVTITYWWWAESDAPGADKWMEETVAAYEKLHPEITINVVPQATDTLTSTFQTAAASSSGPDIAANFATGPVLSFVWSGAITPISDLLPAEETSHWLNTNENMYDGKLWAAPMYILGIFMDYNTDLLAKAGVTPPPLGGRWSWDEFVAACATLKAAGITPLVGGDKNGWLGAWWFANLGIQSLDSTDDLRQAVIGNASFTDPKHSAWIGELEKLVKAGYFNDDVMSLDLDQGARAFAQGKGAIGFGTDGMVRMAASDLGSSKVGVMRWPLWGNGKLATAGNATQSISFFVTKWSKHQKEAADFIQFMHTPERLAAWFQATGVAPADDRFDVSTVTDPLTAAMLKAETTGPQIWLENWLPPQIDADGDIPAGQTILSGSGSAADAAQIWESAASRWRSQHPDELAKWQNWKQ